VADGARGPGVHANARELEVLRYIQNLSFSHQQGSQTFMDGNVPQERHKVALGAQRFNAH
jgi:hypothetical protein